MKKILLLVSTLILTAACAAPPTNTGSAPPANANAASQSASVAATEADAIAQEKAIWDTIKKKDYEAFGNMLADDQLEVTGEGVFDKAGSIASVKEFEPSEVVFSDWKFLSVDKDAYIVMYTANVKGKYKGQEFPPESGRNSSAWVKRAGKWLAVYHQQCLIASEPVVATPPKSPAKATASPAGTPAVATTGADPIANEKIVWDFFKTKNYDGFAAVLAPEFIEVATTGVYDKAGSVKGIKETDVSKLVLSDWKTNKLDDDAALVTYTVKVPGMPGSGERHSTIWAMRDGKWLAVFHHAGTATMAPVMLDAPKESASPKGSASPATKAPAK